jgi:hypothetical protein
MFSQIFYALKQIRNRQSENACKEYFFKEPKAFVKRKQNVEFFSATFLKLLK